MLSEKSYDKAYVSACRTRFMDALDSYSALNPVAGSNQPVLTHMILALDHYFLHRMRGAEGKDGNALNEVRMLCNAIKHHGGIMQADSTIKYDSARAILSIPIGDTIMLEPADVRRLADAFFAAIEARYP